MGDSPFDKNFLKIKEKKSLDQEIPCIYLRGYAFKLNDQFSVTYKGRLHTYCDGQESFCDD
ncbi:hypothetical protein DXU93_09280 [Brumimicrobium aurantiacum]|uniref:Uncharacterized protein n=1 Tax=Brumimicrobium aurantiacum TaxID=1737063 RepID=A0A3E1EXC4_9FLAO|nr:hypothetical protein DXU93_09280 [Brumimicrobium aurantiacum]